MSFEDLPLIPAGNVFRAAMVSGDRGERAVRELTDASAIAPTVTPTGRTLLTASDAKRVFEAIVTVG